MAKPLSEAPLTTRNARARLSAGLYWRGIDPQTHLGYRKGKRGGRWLVRWRNGAGYRQAPIGTADDAIATGTLDYNAAIRAARAKVEVERAEARVKADGPLLTVRSAVETYIAELNARYSRRTGRTVRSDADNRLSRYVIGRKAEAKQEDVPPAPLADVPLHELTESDLRAWRSNLPSKLKETSKKRTATDLRAALNAAHETHRERLGDALPMVVKHGLKVIETDDDDDVRVARENQVLPDIQVEAVVRAAHEVDAEGQWEGDFFRLIMVLAATGARFCQAARMRVSDVQPSLGRLLVPVSRKGKGSKAPTIAVPVGKDVLDALLPVVVGRPNSAPLLERWRHKQEPGSNDWQREQRGAWQRPSEMSRPWHAVRQQAGMPDVIPYALRHSSIVRGLRAGLPIRLVAALHDTSVLMIERHYGKWIVENLNDLAARAVIPLVPKRP